MAFDSRYLNNAAASRKGYAPVIWTYKSTDTSAVVGAASYFPAAHAGLFAIGDEIVVTQVDALPLATVVLGRTSLMVTNITTAGVVSTFDITQTGTLASGVVRMPFYFNQTDLLAPTSQWVIAPVAGTLQRVVTVVKLGVTTGGIISVNLAGAAVTGLSITIADAATAGTVQVDSPTSVTAVTAGQAVEIAAGTPFATAGEVFGYVEFMPFAPTTDIFIPFIGNATDLSAGTSNRQVNPVAGQIIEAACVVTVAIVTGGAITFEIADVAVVGLSLTVADAATVGTVVTDTPTSLTGVTGAIGQNVGVETVFAAAFNGGGAVTGYIRVRPTVAPIEDFVFYFANQTDVLAGTSHYVAVPNTGWVNRAGTIAQVAVTTGGAITYEIANVAVGGLTVTVADGGGVADLDTGQATYHILSSEINADTALEVVFAAAFATAGAINGYAAIERR